MGFLGAPPFLPFALAAAFFFSLVREASRAAGLIGSPQ
jgi:hypothetical protein